MALTQEQFNKFKTTLLKNKEKTGNTLLGIGKNPEVGKDNESQLRYILGTKKIPAGVQTNVGDVLSIISATKTFAKNNPEGKFPGLARGIRLPGVLQSEKGIQNRQAIESMNLLTQVWASGAALTEAQTKQVKRFTPDKNDTDRQVRAKVKGLIQFLYADLNGKLQGTGIFAFKPQTEDYFKTEKNLQNINFKF